MYFQLENLCYFRNMDLCLGRYFCINRKNVNVMIGILFSVIQVWYLGFVLNYLDDGSLFSDGYFSGINYCVFVGNRVFLIYVIKCEV